MRPDIAAIWLTFVSALAISWVVGKISGKRSDLIDFLAVYSIAFTLPAIFVVMKLERQPTPYLLVTTGANGVIVLAVIMLMRRLRAAKRQ